MPGYPKKPAKKGAKRPTKKLKVVKGVITPKKKMKATKRK
jgi:hypothetical protein